MMAAVTPTRGVKQTEATKKVKPERPFLAAIIHAKIAQTAQTTTHSQLLILLFPGILVYFHLTSRQGTEQATLNSLSCTNVLTAIKYDPTTAKRFKIRISHHARYRRQNRPPAFTNDIDRLMARCWYLIFPEGIAGIIPYGARVESLEDGWRVRRHISILPPLT